VKQGLKRKLETSPQSGKRRLVSVNDDLSTIQVSSTPANGLMQNSAAMPGQMGSLLPAQLELPQEVTQNCIDVQRLHHTSVHLIQSLDGSYNCAPGPLTQFPEGGWAFVSCKMCVSASQIGRDCNCTNWLKESAGTDELAEILESINHVDLPLDEMLVPEHAANCILGPCACRDDATLGALNIRQMTNLMVNVVAVGFLRKKS